MRFLQLEQGEKVMKTKAIKDLIKEQKEDALRDMKSKTQHTPTPWRFKTDDNLMGEKRAMQIRKGTRTIAEVMLVNEPEDQYVNGLLIVRAVNAYEDLLKENITLRIQKEKLLEAAKVNIPGCNFDVLNPCWDNRPTDKPGKHWGIGEACPSCKMEAVIAQVEKEKV